MQEDGLSARDRNLPSHFDYSTEAVSPGYRKGYKDSQWTPSLSLLPGKYTMFFPANAHWRACCVVSLLLLGDWHFGTHDQKSSSSYSCQVVPAVHTMGASFVWVRTPEFPEKAELVEKQPLFSDFKSKLLKFHTTAFLAHPTLP